VITDTLRPPAPFDPAADAYKDWLHLNVFDHASGCIGIFNTSLHGAPHDGRARAVGTALVHSPVSGWVGNVEVAAAEDANIGATSIGLERIAIGTDPATGTVLASARLRSDGLEAGITATSRARAIDIEHRVPFGSGWISWYAIPRLSTIGGWSIDGWRYDLSSATAYHDHNWGRWHWGDDAGWEWATCASVDPAVTVVLSRATDRAHRTSTGTLLFLDVDGERRSFPDPAVEITLDGRLAERVRRLPGALAALHQDRIGPALPARIRVRAADGVDSLGLTFEVRAAVQLIAGDPVRRGYGFLHQMVGEFTANCTVAGRTVACGGLGVFEYVV
jgi:hypothetical protein